MSKIFNGDLIYINSISDVAVKDANNFLEGSTNILDDFSIKKDWDCAVETTKDAHLNILNVVELTSLKLEIIKHCDQYMRLNQDFYDGFVDCSWFNRYKKEYYQEFHRHDHKLFSYFSGVVYLTEKNSDIHFFIDNTFKFTPKLGSIVIFDSKIEHRVLANKNDNLRISLAFNFRKCHCYD